MPDHNKIERHSSSTKPASPIENAEQLIVGRVAYGYNLFFPLKKNYFFFCAILQNIDLLGGYLISLFTISYFKF